MSVTKKALRLDKEKMMATQMTWEELPIKAKFNKTVKPGDKVWTFTGVYGGRSISINSGVFRGVKTTTTDGKQLRMPEYIVERADGSLTRIQYPQNIAPITLTLQDLDGHYV